MYLVGKIVGTHGIKGELKVITDSSFDRLAKGNIVYINDKEVKITSNRLHKNYNLITINDLYDINKVLDYVGKDIYVLHNRDELNYGEYYYEDLIGLRCFDSKNNYIGNIIDLQEVPQGLILEISSDKKTILVPYVKEFIKEIDIEQSIVLINEIEGLL